MEGEGKRLQDSFGVWVWCELLKTADDGPYRVMVFSHSTGKVFWEGKAYDPATNSIANASAAFLRSRGI